MEPWGVPFSYRKQGRGGGCSSVGRAGGLVIGRSLVGIPAPLGRD